MAHRFPITGDKAYVKKRVKMLTANGDYKALHNPKLDEGPALSITPKWMVTVEKVDKK